MPEDMDLEKWAHQQRKAYLVESIPENGLVESSDGATNPASGSGAVFFSKKCRGRRRRGKVGKEANGVLLNRRD